MDNIMINKNMYFKNSNNNYSIPNVDFKKLNNKIEANEKEVIIDMRKKQFSLDNISNNNEKDTTLIVQPSLKDELNLESDMFAAYPQSNIPFSYSNSWIGM